jgi:hypothetical protein
MALFTLERDMDAPDDDLGMENTMFRVIGSAFLCNVHWLRSYNRVPSERILGFCVYESGSADSLQTASHTCGVPYVRIAEVEEVCAPGIGRGVDPAPEGYALMVVERIIPHHWTSATLREANEGISRTNDVNWLRSYWEVGARRVRCVFVAASQECLAEALGDCATETRIFGAALNHPSQWARLYDSFALPHHWDQQLAPEEGPLLRTS